MVAGALRERITVQRHGDSFDQFRNANSDDWADVPGMIGLNAQIRPLRASELVSDEGVADRATVEITIRYTSQRAGIRIGDRIIDARTAETYNVKSPPQNIDQRHKMLKILAEAGGADG